MDHELSNLNYRLLPLSRWYINERLVKSSAGFRYVTNGVKPTTEKRPYNRL